MSDRLNLEMPDFVHSEKDPQRELAKLYTDAKMGITLVQMASLGFPLERCLKDKEPGVKCTPGIAALKEVFSENVFGNLFSNINSYRSVDDVVQDITGNIDSYLLLTVRYKEVRVKTLTAFYLIYTRQRKKTTGFDVEYRYLFRNSILIYKDRGDTAKGPINSIERDRKWGIDPELFIDSLKMVK
ncbi:MAG: hypothetical protein G01um101448_856 [Parcubacteria group bacterium Gr01-1014_48]|nr:MAG: hypothetical protein Greene041614_1012 [Parcubacteria group bacterium Greene0416_14]TSC73218.1 MAG: hypothetical protein G01um101448_856 [Parcubacteria group bacterium Gr01-1014_48]TSD00482.1 MAG: hypothetical protein Greene101415_831 [Parcubacteria group bacterium Greene1014_15]TSD08383.1 MAG: hypothetical protein Greene07144_99 [Parcubacteria group bacterium Greene0714_4]